MTFASSFLYAQKLFFSKTNRGSEKTTGQRSLAGAIVCIAVSLVPLVAVLSVSSGMISGITGRMIHLSSHDIQVSADSTSSYVQNEKVFSDMAESFCKIDGVTAAYPEVHGMALAAGTSYRNGATIRAVKNDVFECNRFFTEFFEVVDGKADLSSRKNAVIGKKLAETLSLKPGDTLKLITVKSGAEKIVPKVSLFTVSGIVSCGYQELDALWVFVSLENAFSTFAGSSLEYTVGLETDCTFERRLDDVLDSVNATLKSDGEFERSIAESWKTVNASSFENFASTKALLVVVMLAIILVASINISSAIVMIVMERKKEIAILKSTGASSFGIACSFVMTGLFSGVSGVIIGVPLGLLVSVFINPIISFIEHVLNFSFRILSILSFSHISAEEVKILDPAFYLQRIPVVIPWGEVALIVCSTLVLSVVMSMLPSIKAGKSTIIDVLSKN